MQKRNLGLQKIFLLIAECSIYKIHRPFLLRHATQSVVLVWQRELFVGE